MPQDDQPEIKRVLAVDDHPGVLDALADALKLLGFEVFTATSGRGISEIVSAHSIDLLITDLGMPDEDGIEIVRRMRLEYPHLKIIVVSGTFGLEMFKAVRLLGANATLGKPVRVAELRDCIRRISAN